MGHPLTEKGQCVSRKIWFSPRVPLFSLHMSFLLNSPECSHGSYLTTRLVRALPQRWRTIQTLIGREERSREGATAGSRSWKWDRMGRSILEHVGLSVKYVSPAVPAVFYSWRSLVVPTCMQGDIRLSEKGWLVGMGSSWCHQGLVIAGKLASSVAHCLMV